MKNVKTLISDLRQSNVRLSLKGENIEIDAPKGALTTEMISDIRMQKGEILEYLRKNLGNAVFNRIKAIEKKDCYPMSASQRRLWILSQFEGGNSAYNMVNVFVFEGALNRGAVSYAFETLLQRHEILRTVFREDKDGVIKQYIYQPTELNFRVGYHDLRNDTRQEEKIRELLSHEAGDAFDLTVGPLLRAALIQLEDEKCIFSYTMHHIISDGWSMGILMNELLVFYNAFGNGSGLPLPELPIQYKDYAAWQQEQLTGDSLMAHKSYWLKQFEGNVPVLELPGDKPRPSVKTYNGSAVGVKIESHAAQGIKSLCQENGATLFMGLVAVIDALLYHYTSQEDITIGTPVAAREHVDLVNQIGFYTNTLALRTRFNADEDFSRLLKNVKQVALGAYEHQVFPFDELIEELKFKRDASRNPLFDIQVVVQNAQTDKREDAGESSGNLKVSQYDGSGDTVSVFDMVFNFVELEEDLHLSIVFNTDIYAERTIRQLAAHTSQIMEAIATYPEIPVRQLSFLSTKDKEQLLNFSTGRKNVFPGKTVVDLFTGITNKVPELPAVVHAGQQLSYNTVQVLSGRLAAYLTNELRLEPGGMVGVMLDRSGNTVIAILGIMKAGGIYVPIDPGYPVSRKEFMVRDTRMRILITQTDYIFDVAYFDGTVLAIDVQLDTMKSSDQSIPGAGETAYVIYTSGSTGSPKGVMIGHRALANSIQAQQEIFNLKQHDRCLQFLSSSFDVSIFEIFICLTTGGTLYIVDEDDKKDPILLEQFISNNAVNIVTLPAAYVRMLDFAGLSSVKKLISGGEAISPGVVSAVSKYLTFYNAYGPTESAICVSIFCNENGELIGNKATPIGKPVPNTQIYILNDRMELQPIGVIGEIYLGGDNLANGYLNNPQLTSEKFIPHPFQSMDCLYKTGDMGRWLPDGNIEFIGRQDDQVKIQGFRTELGEIEAVLQKHPGTISAAVITRAITPTDKELVVYFTGLPDLSTADIKAYLNEMLPAHQQPAYILRLDAMPLTINGKIDKKNLPDPTQAGISAETGYVAANTATEQVMVKIWEEILGREKIGIKDDYFELGGSSLKAMVLIKKTLDQTGVSLPMKILFEQKNIESIAKYIDDLPIAAGRQEQVRPLSESDRVVEASYNQLMYFSEWKSGDEVVVTWYAYDVLDIDIFRHALNQLIRRHEILRTRFVYSGNKIMQHVIDAAEAEFGDLPVAEIDTTDAMNEISRIAQQQNINPVSEALFFVNLYKTSAGSVCVMFRMHHIITDGYSAGIIQNELMTIYSSISQHVLPELTSLPFQYKDFSAWQRNFIDSENGIVHKNYWLKRLKNFNPKLMWREEVPAHSDESGCTIIEGIIEKERLALLDQFSKANGITRPSLLLGVFTLFLNQLTGQEDITIFTTVSGRNSSALGSLDVSGIIGFFANSLMVRNIVDEYKTAVDHLHQVQHNFLEDLAYDAYPFQRLLYELPDISVTNTFLHSTAFFNYHNYSYYSDTDYTPVYGDGGLAIKKTDTMKNAFGLIVTEYGNCLKLEFAVNSEQTLNTIGKETLNNYFVMLREVLTGYEKSVARIKEIVVNVPC